MRILLTGGSSFTGLWFARALSEAGHEVHATLTRPGVGDYEGLRRGRVDLLSGIASLHGDRRFGEPAFLDLLRRGGPWDLLCHHGAEVTDYRSEDFDAVAALARNAHELPDVIAALGEAGGRGLVLTGSIFEPGEGDEGVEAVAFNPYGLSKGLTFDVFRHYCRRDGLPLGKFVIPNPFGPWEEPRFTSYMANAWRQGESPEVRTPDYLRDNIHVDLLARVYGGFCAEVAATDAPLSRRNPSGYAETQGAFAQRLARELERRGWPAPATVPCAEQTEFPEPRRRVNGESAAALCPDWDEARAWDDLAAWYGATFGEAGP